MDLSYGDTIDLLIREDFMKKNKGLHQIIVLHAFGLRRNQRNTRKKLLP